MHFLVISGIELYGTLYTYTDPYADTNTYSQSYNSRNTKQQQLHVDVEGYEYTATPIENQNTGTFPTIPPLPT